MGEPKATDMPAAAAAERTSLLRAGNLSVQMSNEKEGCRLTFITANICEKLHEKIGATACYMY